VVRYQQGTSFRKAFHPLKYGVFVPMDLGPSPVHLLSISPSDFNITRAEKRPCGFRSLARLPAVKVAYQGEPGAYSEQAVLSLFPSAEPLPCGTVRLVFSRVTSGEADVGVVPVENSQAGSVNETYDLLLHSNLVKVYGEAVVRVDHALLAVRGARLEGIRRVYSHWQALAQSEEFLASLRVEMHPVHDTAGAARMIAERDDPEEAAVASIEAGSRFGLKVLAERIQTYPDNFTKFAVIGTGDPGLGPPDKTSLVMAVHDRPGSLLASLQPFADRDVNLTKLESRPRPGAPFEYVFYVDIARAADDEAVLAALEQVRSHTSLLKVLGSYPSHPIPL
jgi:prephenate dehydratase